MDFLCLISILLRLSIFYLSPSILIHPLLYLSPSFFPVTNRIYSNSSELKLRRPGFDSRHYKKKSSGSGTGPTQPREYN
jgi:hypothetical protein